MLLAKVIGTVVCSVKYKSIEGIALRVLQPCNEKAEPRGEPIVACDPIHCRHGDLVMWVAKREASLALPGAEIINMYPVDATVTGLVDMVGDRRT